MEWFIFIVATAALTWVLFKMVYTLNRFRDVDRRHQGIVIPIFRALFDPVFWLRVVTFLVDGVLTTFIMFLTRLTVPGRVGAAVGGTVALILSVIVLLYERSLTSH